MYRGTLRREIGFFLEIEKCLTYRGALGEPAAVPNTRIVNHDSLSW